MRRSAIIAVLTLTVAATPLATAPAAAQTDSGTKAASPTATARASLDDPTIVAIFDGANTVDIESGRLAAERGHTKAVRDFGAMLARDHAQVRQRGRDLAARLHVTPTPPKDDTSARDHAAAMKRLRALHGAAFDRAFLEHEVAFHTAVIDAVTTTLLPAIRNAELKALVVEVAPAFEAHRLAASNLEKQLAGR